MRITFCCPCCEMLQEMEFVDYEVRPEAIEMAIVGFCRDHVKKCGPYQIARKKQEADERRALLEQSAREILPAMLAVDAQPAEGGEEKR